MKKTIIGLILLVLVIAIGIGLYEFDEKRKEKKIIENAQNQVIQEQLSLQDKYLESKAGAQGSLNKSISENNQLIIHQVTPAEMSNGIAHSQNGYNERTISIIQGQIKLSDYYNYNFTNSEEYASVQITDKETFKTFYGYAKRESFSKLLDILSDGQEHNGTVSLIQFGETLDDGAEEMGTVSYLDLF